MTMDAHLVVVVEVEVVEEVVEVKEADKRCRSRRL